MSKSADLLVKELNIQSPDVIYILNTVKAIQKRMKDPDMVNAEYIRVYDQMCKEFDFFVEKYTDIFTSVITGKKMGSIGSVLFHKNKMDSGKVSNEKLRDALMHKYWPQNLIDEAQNKMSEMNQSGMNNVNSVNSVNNANM